MMYEYFIFWNEKLAALQAMKDTVPKGLQITAILICCDGKNVLKILSMINAHWEIQVNSEISSYW